jgi:hypothetical protein
LWRPLPQGAWLPPAAGRLAAPGRAWQAEPTPNPATQPNGALLAGSCSSPAACAAVGSAFNDAGTTVTLAERWNGSHWAAQATPRPAGAVWSNLLGVSCTRTAACTAVGYYQNGAGDTLTLAESWNGTRWTVVATPNPAGSNGSGLFAVSCTAPTACTATGDYNNSAGAARVLAERWNGTRWAIQATPNPPGAADAGLFGVSCTSSRACTAAGASASVSGLTTTLAQTWNGSHWLVRATPNPAGSTGTGFNAVSCTSQRACTAAGSYLKASGAGASLAERWNGSRWTLQAIPDPKGATGSALLAVSCAAANACTAVGDYGSTAGGPNSAGPTAAGPNSAGPNSAATAAGPDVSPWARIRHSGSVTAVTLAERWNGTRWTVQATPSPAGNTGGGFAAVSCPSRRACAATGSYGHGASLADVTLAGAWNGSRWTVKPTKNTSGAAFSNLLGVSCPAPAACTAVGNYDTSANGTATLAETWDGGHWTIQPTANPKGAADSALEAVSCTSRRACTAVGDYDRGGAATVAFAETWDGTRWRVHTTPGPKGATASALYAVSCTSRSVCAAVGAYTVKGGASHGFAEAWDGTRWHLRAVPQRGGLSWLNGVSCSSRDACTAVGYSGTGNADAQPLAQAWNGTRWRIQPTPLPGGADGAVMQAVSCTSPTACTATGSLFARPGGAMADRWNGTTWRVQQIPNPPGFKTSTSQIIVSGVSCATAHVCTATGNFTPNNLPASFAAVWNGTRWRQQAASGQAGTIGSILSGVSCAASRCTAVGSYFGPSGILVTLAIANTG